MKNWFEYPESGAERAALENAVSLVCKSMEVSSDAAGLLPYQHRVMDGENRDFPVFVLLETPDEFSEFLDFIRSPAGTDLNLGDWRGENIASVMSSYDKNRRCLVQIWYGEGSAAAMRAWKRLDSLCKSCCVQYDEISLPGGVDAAIVRDSTLIMRAIHLFGLPHEKAPSRVSVKEALAVLDGID